MRSSRAPLPVLGLGVAGSLLLVVGGFATGRLPADTWTARLQLLRWWRGLSDDRALGMVVSGAGLVLLTVAWIGLVRRVRGRSDGVAIAVATAVVWSLPLFLGGPLFSGDGWSYVATGWMTGHGLDPYHQGVAGLAPSLSSGVSRGWLHTPTPYGPLPLLWGAAFSRLTSDPWLLLAAYRLLALVALLALAWGVERLARRQGLDPAVAVALACASPFVLAHGIGGLHNDLVMAAFGVAALVTAREGRWGWAAALVGAAAAVKVPGVFFGVGVVLVSLPAAAGWGARLVRTAVVAIVAAAVVLVSGIPDHLGLGWIGALDVPELGRVHLAPVPMVAAAVHWAAGLVGADGVASTFSSVHAMSTASVLAVVVGVLVVLRWPTGPRRRVLVGAGLALLGATVLSPVSHYWYFLWCMPLLCAVRLPREWVAAVAAEVLALGLTPIFDPSLQIGWISAVGCVAVAGAPIVAYAVVRLRGDRADLREEAGMWRTSPLPER